MLLFCLFDKNVSLLKRRRRFNLKFILHSLSTYLLICTIAHFYLLFLLNYNGRLYFPVGTAYLFSNRASL